jgi:hypothetical protein
MKCLIILLQTQGKFWDKDFWGSGLTHILSIFFIKHILKFRNFIFRSCGEKCMRCHFLERRKVEKTLPCNLI